MTKNKVNENLLFHLDSTANDLALSTKGGTPLDTHAHQCVGCGNSFQTLFPEGSLHCTPDCEKNHTLLKKRS